MTRQKRRVLVHVVAVAAAFLVLPITFLVQIRSVTAVSEMASLDAGSAACDTFTDPMERDLCHFVTGIYPDGLLTNWPNPRLPGHFDHAPMRDYAEPPDQEVISESTSMLALIAAQLGDQTTFDYLVDVSAPAEIGGTGAPMSSSRESPYYFASPNLCLTHWVLDKDGRKEDSGTDWHANAAGEESRWLEALSIAEQRFPERRDSYRLFANCLAWGLMGATDFDPRAIGNFEDPGTPEEFDNFLMRPYFGWRDDFSAFATVTTTNLSYNNLMAWRYAAQLGEGLHTVRAMADAAGGVETVTVLPQAVGAIRIDLRQPDSGAGYMLYEVEALSPFTTENLLLHADCTSSSHERDETCEMALDGDPSTRWHSEQTGPQWLVITPTHASRITTVTLHWGKDDPPRYGLSATWPFADFYAKVLRHTTPLMADSIQHCRTDLPRVMYDIERHFHYGEILTPNLACSMVVTPTASSTQDRNPDVAPPKAIDCDPNTRWSSNWTDNEWIALEFDEPVTVDGVVLKWEQAYGKAYTIDVSDDGRTWTSVFAETNGDGQVDEIHFPLTTTRRVRMHGSSRAEVQGKTYGYSLFEFEVYRGGTSSLTALDLARRAGAYAKESDDPVLWETGRRILDWYKARYPSIAAAYDPCTGEPLPGVWENGEWSSIMADLAELAAEYGECAFARQVVAEKLRPKLNTDRNDPLFGTVGPSAFENLEVLLALRRAAVDPCCGSITRQWQELHPIGSSPPLSAGHTAVYDKDNQRMVVYGVAPFVTDTYSLILKLGRESWDRLTPTGTAPRLEGGHSAIICGPGNRMIIWSGKHGTVEARALDLTLGRERWVTIPVTGAVPPGRTGHSAVCDSANNRMIIFGGYFGGYPHFRNDTWALYLTPGEERWEELTPEPEPRPAIRASHAAIYDESNQRMIVYGGTTWRWGRHGDVWALDLTLGDETWEELSPSCASPAPRTASPAVYDATSDRMLFFGGDAGGGYLNDAVALNLTAGREEWHGIVPSGTVPEKRAGHSAIYDVMNRRVVIFGGMNSTDTLGDVFALPEPRIFLPYTARYHEIALGVAAATEERG